MNELQRWLASVGLEQLAHLFQSNDVDMEVLADLTEADLEKIGVSLGLRRKLLKALEQLRRPPEIAQSTFPDAAKGRRCRAQAVDGDVLRPRRFHGSIARS